MSLGTCAPDRDAPAARAVPALPLGPTRPARGWRPGDLVTHPALPEPATVAAVAPYTALVRRADGSDAHLPLADLRPLVDGITVRAGRDHGGES